MRTGSDSETTEPALHVSQVEFAVTLPDGSTKDATLTDQQVRELVGTEKEYSLSWWLRGVGSHLAIHEVLASMAGQEKDGAARSALEYGCTCSYRCNPDEPAPSTPRLEVTYRTPKVIKIAAV
jgi:hypothetical protein